MKIRKIKRLFGLCQCKGCMRPYDTIIATYFGKYMYFYPTRVCGYHACNLMQFPYVE